MHFSESRVVQLNDRIDIDGDGEVDVEVLDTGYRYPLLARWSRGDKTFMAAASHFLVQKKVDDGFETARKEVEKRLRTCDHLQIRTLASAESFKVGPSSGRPESRDLGRNGEFLKALVEIRDTLNPVADVEPDFLYFVNHGQTPHPVKVSNAAIGDEIFSQRSMDLIRAPEAWQIQTGSEKIRVAIIDTGIDPKHPDLRENIRRVDREKEWITAWDFHNGRPNTSDDHSHGTYCAGLIGAVAGNKTGLRGVNWEVSLLPLKAFDEDGIGTAAHASEAIRFAVSRGAHVILCAWGGNSGSCCLRSAVEFAQEKGVTIVASAGNAAVDLEKEPHFPASFHEFDNVIAVGGTDADGNPSKDFGHGRYVRLSAPAVDVYSSVPTSFRPYLPYTTGQGTSAAAALVAGACALIQAEVFPKLMSPKELRSLLEDTANQGLLDIRSALDKLPKRKKSGPH